MHLRQGIVEETILTYLCTKTELPKMKPKSIKNANISGAVLIVISCRFCLEYFTGIHSNKAMKSYIFEVFLVSLALALADSAVAQNNITGTWKSHFNSQIGIQDYMFELKMDGTNLAGRAIGKRENGTNDVAIMDGKIDGDKISFNEPLTIQDNDVTVEYSGTIEGDELKLHRKVGDFAEYDIVANRVPAAATPAGQSVVDGKWEGQFDSQIGTQRYTFTFKSNGSTLAGRAYGVRDDGTNDVAITEGKINPDNISFVEPLSFNGNDIRIEYTGKISGDEIKLHRKVGDFAEEDLVVKRVRNEGIQTTPVSDATSSGSK